MKKIIQVLLLTAAILAFAGWGKAEHNTGNQHTLRASATRSTVEAETDGKAGENESEVPTEKEEIGETPTEDLPDMTAAPIEATPPAPQAPQEPQEPKESTPVTEPPKTDPPETEPVVTEPPNRT